MKKDRDNVAKYRLRSSTLTTLVSISLVLLMLGMLGMIVLHAKKISEHVKENIGFTVMMKEQANEAAIFRFQKELDAKHYIKSTEYITREKAAEDLEKMLGEEFIGFIGYTLPPSLEIRLNAAYANNDSLAVIEQSLLKNNLIKEVIYQEDLVHLVNDNIRQLSFIILGFSAILLLIAIALINNTIRLSVFSKRFIIKSMQLVGATQSFIRRPFVIRGTVYGLIGGFLAIGFLIGIYYFLRNQIPEILEIQDIDLMFIVFGAVVLAGIIIAWISTHFAVRKYLKIKTDQLYYF